MSHKGPLILLGAMDEEIKAFLDYFDIEEKHQWNNSLFYSARFKEKHIIIAKTGVGKVLAAATAQKLIDTFNPSAIVFTGIAGSINANLKIGDILLGVDSVQHDFDARPLKFKLGEIPYTNYRFLACDENLMNIASTYKSSEHSVIKGRILTGDQFIAETGTKDYTYLTKELNGDCVEMEGAAVALVSTINHIPHLIIRTISDKAHKGAKMNFREFLKQASDNSLQIAKHILEKL